MTSRSTGAHRLHCPPLSMSRENLKTIMGILKTQHTSRHLLCKTLWLIWKIPGGITRRITDVFLLQMEVGGVCPPDLICLLGHRGRFPKVYFCGSRAWDHRQIQLFSTPTESLITSRPFGRCKDEHTKAPQCIGKKKTTKKGCAQKTLTWGRKGSIL